LTGRARPARARSRSRPLPVGSARLHAGARALRGAGAAHTGARTRGAALVHARRRGSPRALRVACLHAVARALRRPWAAYSDAAARDAGLAAALHWGSPLPLLAAGFDRVGCATRRAGHARSPAILAGIAGLGGPCVAGLRLPGGPISHGDIDRGVHVGPTIATRRRRPAGARTNPKARKRHGEREVQCFFHPHYCEVYA
jgi:hypothetical protein